MQSSPLHRQDVRGRVRTPADRKAAILAEFAQSGMTGMAFAAHVGVKYPTFAVWCSLDLIQKPQELLVAMSLVTAANHLAGGYVQRGKQGSGSVTVVVVGAAPNLPRPHRQHRLAAIQGLDPGADQRMTCASV